MMVDNKTLKKNNLFSVYPIELTEAFKHTHAKNESMFFAMILPFTLHLILFKQSFRSATI